MAKRRTDGPAHNAAEGGRVEERRAAPRIVIPRKAHCRLGLAGRPYSWRARVRDISAGGVGLLLDFRFEPGTTLALELRHAKRRQTLPLSVQVKHASPLEDGEWLLGTAFERPLTEDEVQALL